MRNKSNKYFLKSLIFVSLLSVAIFFGVQSISKTVKADFDTISEKLDRAGYVSDAKPAGDMYLINYHSDFSVQSSEAFAEKVGTLLPILKKGDVVLLGIESSGGASVSCSHSFDQVKLMQRKGIKVVSATDYIAASCAYKLASAADIIIATSGAMIGNIGTVLTLNKRDNSNKVMIGSSRTKEIFAGAAVKTDSDKQIARNFVNAAQKDFVSRILEKRKDKITDHNTAFSGNIFSGKQAKQLGLIDKIGDIRSFMIASHLVGFNIIIVN
jgi:ClpP class serine protease